MADDPAEELFAGVAVEEAAIEGVCVFEAEVLMDSVGGVRRGGRAVACAVVKSLSACEWVVVGGANVRL